MKYRNKIYIAASVPVAAFLFVLACATRTTPAPAAAPTLAPVSGAVSTRSVWEEQWKMVNEAAKKEGHLVLVSGAVNPQTRDGVSKAFENKFGIPVEFWQGRGAETVARLDTERRAGIFSADVYVGGTTTPIIGMKPKGMLDPLDKVLLLPEVVDDKNWQLFSLYFDKGHTIAGGFMTVSPYAYINTNLVKPEEFKTLDDLLNPKWKGRIVMNDPTTEGTGHDRIWTITKARNVDFLRKLVEQKPVVIRDQRQLTEWVARGKYPVGIAIPETLAGEFQAAGAPLTAVLAEESNITTGIGAVSQMNSAPHPKAAGLFLNWILTRDGQNLFAKLANHASRRVDVNNEWLPAILKTQPGVKYFIGDESDKLEAGKQIEIMKDIFKPVM